MTTFLSARAALVAELVNQAQLARQGAYFVRRGLPNWSAFPFGLHPKAIAIWLDEQSFLRKALLGTPETAKLFVQAIVYPGVGQEDPVKDDLLIDELVADVSTIVLAVLGMNGPDGLPLSHRIQAGTARIGEVFVDGSAAHGVMAVMDVDF